MHDGLPSVPVGSVAAERVAIIAADLATVEAENAQLRAGLSDAEAMRDDWMRRHADVVEEANGLRRSLHYFRRKTG